MTEHPANDWEWSEDAENGFVNGLYYLKRDLTFLYCAVSKSCNNK